MTSLPMIALATAATVIASQAVITGAYSITQQAIQLGLLPRLEIRHTSKSLIGQIYMPKVKTLVLIGVLLLVGLFRSSSALASAYGIAVTGTMVVTAMMAFVVIWKVWRWSPIAAAALIAPLLALDVTFLAANLLKIFEGGWMPLALGSLVMLLMYTWRRGSRLLFEKSRKLEFPLADLVAMLEKRPPHRISGTAVFLTSDPKNAPTALMHSLKHYKVLHEKNVILTIETAPTPRIDPAERVRLEQISPAFSTIALRLDSSVCRCTESARNRAKAGLAVDIMSTSFFLSRRALKPAVHSGMPRWQDHLFIALSHTANDVTDYQIPTGRWFRWERRSQFDAPPAGCRFTVNGRSTEPMHSPAIACKRMLLRDSVFNVLFELANMRPRPANSVTTRAASFAQTFTRSSAPWVPKASHCKALLDV